MVILAYPIGYPPVDIRPGRQPANRIRRTARHETHHVAFVGTPGGFRYAHAGLQARGLRGGLWTCYGPEV